MAKQTNNQVVEFENIDNSVEFTKEVAIQKLHEGKKVAHRYFMNYEYIKLHKGIVVDENGYEHGTIAQYFAIINTAFNDSWIIFKKTEE
jgi:anti-sigma factor ChrR (cupin superfamily)